jgi:hypothetical protein
VPLGVNLPGKRQGALAALGIKPARLILTVATLADVAHQPAALPGPSDGPR